MPDVNLDDFDFFRLHGSKVTCFRRLNFEGKPVGGKEAWQVEIPYKSQSGCKWRYAPTAAAAWIEANKWRKKGY